MNDLPRQILCEIINQKGKTCFKEITTFQNLLNDLCHGNYKKERRCIIDSIAEGIPSELLSRNEHIPYDILSAQLTNRLKHSGFDPHLARWTVDSWAQALGIIQPPINVGTLSIVANPPEAKIFLNDKLMGISPLEIPDLPGGNYDLKITLKGFETWQKRIDIAAGQKRPVNANLIKSISHEEIFIDSIPREAAQNGQIAIDSVPSNADIYLDSVYQGKTPKIFKGISEGNHHIEIKLHDYPTFSTNTTIYLGKNADIFWEFPRRYPGSIPKSSVNTKSIAYASIAIISIATLYFIIGPFLVPFLGVYTNPDEINDTPAVVITGAPQNPVSSGTFLSESEAGSIAGDITKTYYFDIVNPEKIRFIRITVEGAQFTDYDFVIGQGYVPTFTPAHYDVISDIGLQTEAYDIQNPTNSRYYVVVKNKGNSGGYAISKTIFYT